MLIRLCSLGGWSWLGSMQHLNRTTAAITTLGADPAPSRVVTASEDRKPVLNVAREITISKKDLSCLCFKNVDTQSFVY